MPYKLTPQYRVTVPRSIRNHLDLELGGRMIFEPLPDGSVRIVAENPSLARAQAFGQTPSDVSPGDAVAKNFTDDGFVQYLLNSPEVDGFKLPVRHSRKVPRAHGS